MFGVKVEAANIWQNCIFCRGVGLEKESRG